MWVLWQAGSGPPGAEQALPIPLHRGVNGRRLDQGTHEPGRTAAERAATAVVARAP